MSSLLKAAIMVVHNKIDDGWTIEESIGWAASKYRVAASDLITALAVDMGDLAYD